MSTQAIAPIRFSPNPHVQKFIKHVQDGDVEAAVTEAKLIPAELGGINTADARKLTALNLAVGSGNRKLVKALLKNGANPRQYPDSNPLTTSMKATTSLGNKFDPEMANDLIAAGADVNGTLGGETPLHQAALIGSLEAMEYIHAKGANINARTSLGDSMMMVAAYPDHWLAVEYLLDKGADEKVKNNLGNSLTDLAESSRLLPKTDDGKALERLKKRLPPYEFNERIERSKFSTKVQAYYIKSGMSHLQAVETSQKMWSALQPLPVQQKKEAIRKLLDSLK